MTGPNGQWVQAAPFRAHLRHLMSIGPLTTAEAAVLTGLSAGLVDRLLHGRQGRPLRRVSPDTARRLLRWSAAEVHGLAWCLTPADPALDHLRRLRAAGWDDRQVGAGCGAGVAELAALDAGTARCSRLLTLRLATLARHAAPPGSRAPLEPASPAGILVPVSRAA